MLLLLLYGAVFVVLAMAQFAKQGGFTRQVGHFVVTGQYRLPGEGEPPASPNEYLLEGKASVFFGGLEFNMSGGDEANSFLMVTRDGGREEVQPERMTISGESALFVLPGGGELNFSTHYAGGAPELRISGVFPESIAGAELPYKPLRKTGLKDSGDGQFVVFADGVTYSFGRSPLDSERRLLFLNAGGPVLSYRAIPEKRAFSPDDFIIPMAQSRQSFDEAFSRWLDQNFSLWNRTIREKNDEELTAAYAEEALSRGSYKAAVSAISPAFLNGRQRTYISSVYLGRLGDALRSLNTLDREKLSRISRQINEKSLDFLKEPHVFEYLAARGHANFVEGGAGIIRSADPAQLAPEHTAGILEGFVDWKTYRPNSENPFERLIDQSCFVISEAIRMTPEGDRVCVFLGEKGEAEFNLRLGKALLDWAESSGNDSWAGVARSLILSVLSLGDSSGMVKAGLLLSAEGEITEAPAPAQLTTARLYRILRPGEYGPKALSVPAPGNTIWAWTAARLVSASLRNDILDISVNFPAGETHYMILRGVRPFVKIQLYNIDFRTDPQFERYDSSGWSYNAQEQALLLKMKHRATVEHVQISYQAAGSGAGSTNSANTGDAAGNAVSPENGNAGNNANTAANTNRETVNSADNASGADNANGAVGVNNAGNDGSAGNAGNAENGGTGAVNRDGVNE
jgi:hypothetical protein